jgi:hypothetical protein
MKNLSKDEFEDLIAQHLEHLIKDFPLPPDCEYDIIHTEDGHPQLVVTNETSGESATLHVYIEDVEDQPEESELEKKRLSAYRKFLCVHYWDKDVDRFTKELALDAALAELGFSSEEDGDRSGERKNNGTS